jgi:mono/diheme cytochrome c family protein
MRSTIVAMSLCLGVATTAAAQDPMLARGEKVFLDQKCLVCHSIGVKGNKKGPLDNVGATLSTEEIHAWIADANTMTAKTKAVRKPSMKSYSLPKDDLDALVAYLGALKKK